MIEKRLVQWYAADAGVDLDIAERDIALTYVLCILSEGKYDWSDLARLVRPDRLLATAELVQDVQHSYQFLLDLTAEEAQLAGDPYGREARLYQELVATIASWGESHGSGH